MSHHSSEPNEFQMYNQRFILRTDSQSLEKPLELTKKLMEYLSSVPQADYWIQSWAPLELTEPHVSLETSASTVRLVMTFPSGDIITHEFKKGWPHWKGK